MLSAKQYYSYINERFIKKNRELFSGCGEDILVSRAAPEGVFDRLLELLDRVEEKYEFNLQGMCSLNYNKFILWQEEFCGGYIESNLVAATELILFCCLADKFLDSGRFSDEEKESICSGLHSEYFVSREPYAGGACEELDELLNHIRVFLVDGTGMGTADREAVAVSLEKAFLSEIYMYRNPLKMTEAFDSKEMHKLTDKSVEFEIAAFLIASAGSNSEESMRAAACAGRIFWLADDLCDFVEDLKYGRKNSALFYCVESPGGITLADRAELAFCNIDIFIERLEQEIALLKECVGSDLYAFIMAEVWKWCKDVRRLAE